MQLTPADLALAAGSLFRVTVAHRGAAPTEITSRFLNAEAAHEHGMSLRRLPEDKVSIQPLRPASVEFIVGGIRYPLAKMLRDNAEDEDLTGWLLTARAGDSYEAMHAERVECVALGGFTEAELIAAGRASNENKALRASDRDFQEAMRLQMRQNDIADVIARR